MLSTAQMKEEVKRQAKSKNIDLAFVNLEKDEDDIFKLFGFFDEYSMGMKTQVRAMVAEAKEAAAGPVVKRVRRSLPVAIARTVAKTIEDEGDDSNHNEEDDGRKCSKECKKKPNIMPVESPLEVILYLMEKPNLQHRLLESDSPDDSDTDETKESLLRVDGAGMNKTEQKVMHRIRKLLNAGFHDQSIEQEGNNAMDLAQRLMRKYLWQALILNETNPRIESNDHKLLKGGLVRLRIVYRKTRAPWLYGRWLSELEHSVCKIFGVKVFSRHCNDRFNLLFYGIYTNAQIAGYAFKVAAERISVLIEYHHPLHNQPWNDAMDSQQWLIHAEGFAKGMSEEIEKNQAALDLFDHKVMDAEKALQNQMHATAIAYGRLFAFDSDDEATTSGTIAHGRSIFVALDSEEAKSTITSSSKDHSSSSEDDST